MSLLYKEKNAVCSISMLIVTVTYILWSKGDWTVGFGLFAAVAANCKNP